MYHAHKRIDDFLLHASVIPHLSATRDSESQGALARLRAIVLLQEGSREEATFGGHLSAGNIT